MATAFYLFYTLYIVMIIIEMIYIYQKDVINYNPPARNLVDLS